MNRKKLNIGVLVGNIESEYCHELCLGIEHAVKELGYSAVLFSGMVMKDFYEEKDCWDHDSRYNTIYAGSAFAGLDLFIISLGTISDYIGVIDGGAESFLSRFQGKPLIILEHYNEKYPCITIDNKSGMQACMKYLIDICGYKRIALLSGKADNFDSNQREEVYFESMKSHGLHTDESMLARGDFSTACDTQVAEILDSNPDIEALVCANDSMAIAAYREIGRRGLTVGTDIAVTGFDDLPMAKAMDPPLSTVSVNTYSLGYNAVYEAERVYEGKETIIKSIPTEFVCRSSAAVSGEETDAEIFSGIDLSSERYVDEITRRIATATLIRSGNIEVGLKVMDTLRPLISCIADKSENRAPYVNDSFVKQQLRKIISGENSENISVDSFQRSINSFMNLEIERAEPENQNLLMHLLNDINMYITHYYYNSVRSAESGLRKHTWLTSYITRDALSENEYHDSVYSGIEEKIRSLEVECNYIFLYNTPSVVRHGEFWTPPTNITLKCFHDSRGISVFKDNEVTLRMDEMFDFKYFHTEPGKMYLGMGIYMNQEQFGIMISSGGVDDFDKVTFACLQLGSTVKYLRLAKIKEEIQNKLRKNNRILSKQSNLDELTGLLNRRGFLSEIRTSIDISEGKKAIVVFCDIDNLKSINDRFGHAEGDWAIRTAAEILKNSFRSQDRIGRMGGDEFTALCIMDDPDYSFKTVHARLNNAQAAVNANSGKDYFVELSFGFSEFICRNDTDIGDIIATADEKLYSAKKKKRPSALK